MIKLLVFDLDGVLARTKEMHHLALNMAFEKLAPEWKISDEDHMTMYDGIPTYRKLDMMVEKGLNRATADQIFKLKQELTIPAIEETVKPNERLELLFRNLRADGRMIYVASNAARKTVISTLSNLGVLKHVEMIFSNDDVDIPKPHSEMYLRCMVHAGVNPCETLIFEDSKTGRLAAYESGGDVAAVDSPEDLTYDFVQGAIDQANVQQPPVPWLSQKTTVLVPMAGAGSRFEKAGYKLPKPLIDVNGRPMIQRVVDSLKINAHFVYVVQKEHLEKYTLQYLLQLITPSCQIVVVDGLTRGAAETTLAAKKFINFENRHLVILNSDQIIEWDSQDFFYKALSLDGSIATFKADHPKWSFAKVGANGLVTEVAEKNPISDNATAGVYYWNKGSDYVKYAEQMIAKDIRTNNEFYVCPVYNEAIADKKKIGIYQIDRMWGTGTPEDLQIYLRAHHA